MLIRYCDNCNRIIPEVSATEGASQNMVKVTFAAYCNDLNCYGHIPEHGYKIASIHILCVHCAMELMRKIARPSEANMPLIEKLDKYDKEGK